MKKILFLIFASIVTINAKSQTQYVSGMLFFQTEFESEQMKITIAPEYGRFINNTTAVGASLKYQYEKDAQFEHIIIIEPYYRKYFAKNEKLVFFCDGVVGLTVSMPKEGDTALGVKVGVAPGIDVKISEKFYFVSKMGFLGYNQPGEKTKYVRLSLDATNVTFGVRYNL